jgi:hypothetical protein
MQMLFSRLSLTFLLFLAEITNLKKQISNKSQNQKIKNQTDKV